MDFIPTWIDISPKKIHPSANYLAYGCGLRTTRRKTLSDVGKRELKEEDVKEETGNDAKETLETKKDAVITTSRSDIEEMEDVGNEGAAGNDWNQRFYLERVETVSVKMI